MENLAIYSHYTDFEKSIQLVQAVFPKATPVRTESEYGQEVAWEIKEGWFSKSTQVTIRYRQRANPSYRLRGIECPVTKQLTGMYNLVASLPAENQAIQKLILQKIETINAELIFVAEPRLTDSLRKVLLSLTHQLDAVAFANPEQSYSQSPYQHFLDKDLKLILDLQGRTGNGTIELKIESRYFDEPKPARPDQLQRKARSEVFLRQQQVPILERLPCIVSETDVQLRGQAEVIDRMYALTLIAAWAEGIEREHTEHVRERFQIQTLSPEETRMYVHQQFTDDERSTMTWRYEGLNVLLWALGFVEELAYPSELCHVPALLDHILPLERDEFEKQARLRSKEEILDELDKTYRMNWACVNARVKQETPSGNLHGGVVYERHYALNWLTCYLDQEWDHVRTDT